jgi:hypothetical protein
MFQKGRVAAFVGVNHHQLILEFGDRAHCPILPPAQEKAARRRLGGTSISQLVDRLAPGQYLRHREHPPFCLAVRRRGLPFDAPGGEFLGVSQAGEDRAPCDAKPLGDLVEGGVPLVTQLENLLLFFREHSSIHLLFLQS